MRERPGCILRARNLSKKVTEKSFLNRVEILDQLIKGEDTEKRGVVFKRHFREGRTEYPIFVKIESQEYLDLQNVLLDIDPYRMWTMRYFIKFIIKWFIAYYSGETENLPFTKLKKKFLTKEIRKFNGMFKEFMD